MGYFSREGQLFLVGRMTETIVYKNHGISAIDLEALILKIEGVKQVIVVAVKNEQNEEVPAAVIVPSIKNLSTDAVHVALSSIYFKSLHSLCFR